MLNKFYKFFITFASLYILPVVTFAFPKDFAGVVQMFTDIGLAIIPLLAAVAFLVFLVGVGRFIRSAGNEKELKDSKNILIWGIIGLFVLVTIWGIIAFMQSEFGFGSTPLIPQVKIP